MGPSCSRGSAEYLDLARARPTGLNVITKYRFSKTRRAEVSFEARESRCATPELMGKTLRIRTQRKARSALQSRAELPPRSRDYAPAVADFNTCEQSAQSYDTVWCDVRVRSARHGLADEHTISMHFEVADTGSESRAPAGCRFRAVQAGRDRRREKTAAPEGLSISAAWRGMATVC